MEKHVLILGASGGIGAAVRKALPDRRQWAEAQITALSRRGDGFDITDPDSVERHLGPLTGPFDLIVVATGKLDGAGHAPEKSLKALTAEAMMDQFRVNAMGPALVMRYLPRLLPKSRPAHVAVLTARVGSIADNHLGGWYSYRMAKAAANQVVRTSAIELRRSHPQACLIAYHPGTVDTAFTHNYSRDKLRPDQAAAHLLDVLLARVPQESGGFYDWSGAEVPW